MGISEITAGIHLGSTAARKTAGRGKQEWKMSDSLREKITEYAREDAAKNVYMGKKFLSLRKSEVSKVAPDRAGLIRKISLAMGSGGMEYMQKIQEADERWLRILFGEPQEEAEVQTEGMGSVIHVYDENGDEILTYTAGVGWQEKESKAETMVHGALKMAYYDAFRAARQEIRAGSGAAGMDLEAGAQGSFDARA